MQPSQSCRFLADGGTGGKGGALAQQRLRAYFPYMRLSQCILPMLLLIALIGAPFGMGRMMDSVAGHDAEYHMTHMHGIDQGKIPAHDPSTPHYVICSACVSAPPFAAEPVRLVLEAEVPGSLIAKTLNGTGFLPPVPPPRA